MTSYSVAPAANVDLREIWRYVAHDNHPAASGLRDRFQETFLMLARSPLLGEACDHLRPGLRFFCVGNYVVFYEIARRRVRIVRVLHGARDYKGMF